MTMMEDTELIELEDEIVGETENHALNREDFTYDISVCIVPMIFKVFNFINAG